MGPPCRTVASVGMCGLSLNAFERKLKTRSSDSAKDEHHIRRRHCSFYVIVAPSTGAITTFLLTYLQRYMEHRLYAYVAAVECHRHLQSVNTDTIQ